MFEEERPQKRRRVYDDSSNNHNSPRPPITHPDHIWRLLEFQQSADLSVRDNINAFRDFLTSMVQTEDVSLQSKQLKILKQYCDQQTLNANDGLALYDILQTWSFACENNGEAVLSAIPAALAQLLKTISSFLEFREFGLSLIDTLLRRDQLKLFEKGLQSSKSKPHLISPCLRLLTEMVGFDAGARAQQVWSRRDVLLSKFDFLLEQNVGVTDAAERRKPTLRRMSLRLLLALLRYLDSSPKTEMLGQARALHACLRGMLNDGDDIAIDILRCLDTCLVDDAGVTRSALAQFFNSVRLECVAALFRYELDHGQEDSTSMIARAASSLLTKLCTTRQGVLQDQNGWYPPGSHELTSLIPEDDLIDLGLDSINYFDAYKDTIPVVNVQLSLFLRHLKSTDSLQSDLIVKILRAAPELVAEYFSRALQLIAPDSDDALWRCQIALLFAVIELPLPASLNKSEVAPPPSTIVVESILPRCLTRAYLNKLLSSNDAVCKVSGARLLTIALLKLEKVLRLFERQTPGQRYLYGQTSARLIELVEARLPPLKDVLLTLQRTSVTDDSARSPLLECVAMYFKVLPSASSTTFDIGPVMSTLCGRVTQIDAASDLMDQLRYCIDIAVSSSATKWFSKSNAESHTLAAQVLQVVANRDLIGSVGDLARPLQQILDVEGILAATSFSALITSLLPDKKFVADTDVYSLLDSCMVRANQKPVRYLDEIESLQQSVSDETPLSLLACSVAEQWSFATKKHEKNKDALKNIAAWIVRLYSLLDAAGENAPVMKSLQDKMLSESSGKAKEYLQKTIEKSTKKAMSVDEAFNSVLLSSRQNDETKDNSQPNNEDSHVLERFKHEINIPESLAGLTKWSETTDFDLEVQTNRLSRLLFCTASPPEEIRRQTMSLLQTITHTLSTTQAPSTSGIPTDSTTQLLLLMGEISQTVAASDLSSPLPTLVPALAHALLPIITNPAHPMYTKANKFLLRAPTWNTRRLIPYWIDKILLSEPESDRSTTKAAAAAATTQNQVTSRIESEIDWFLLVLNNALRTPLDLALFRRSNLFPHLSSFYTSPTIASTSKLLIRQLLYTATQLSYSPERDDNTAAAAAATAEITSLITSTGLLTWLNTAGVLDLDAANERELTVLREEVWRGCDPGAIGEWMRGCKALQT